MSEKYFLDSSIFACECGNCHYSVSLEIFKDAIHRNDLEIFYHYLRFIKTKDKRELLSFIVLYGSVEMMEAIHNGKPYDIRCLPSLDDPIVVAVRMNYCKMLEWMLEYGYKSRHHDTLYNMMVFVDIRMIKIIHKYHLYDNMTNLLRFILRHHVDTKGSKMYPISPVNYDDEMLKYLAFVHDNFPKCDANTYNWDCANNGNCHLCNRNKMSIMSDEWILTSYDYNSMVQWLPNEMMEDVYSLFS